MNLQGPAAKRGKRPDFPEGQARREEECWQRDQKVHAFRTVLRMLCAGQPLSFNDRCSKETCLEDIKLLLGDLCDMRTFPVWGGRNVVAGKRETVNCTGIMMVLTG